MFYFGEESFMDRDKGIAYCGLACCVCSENENCAGCRNDGCEGKGGCQPFDCCSSRKGTGQEIAGCWECEKFPCDTKMLQNMRIRAFARFIQKYGVQRLIDVLESNERQGVVYHHPGGLVGDYDQFESEEALLAYLCGEPFDMGPLS